jgi:hypothetical protein
MNVNQGKGCWLRSAQVWPSPANNTHDLLQTCHATLPDVSAAHLHVQTSSGMRCKQTGQAAYHELLRTPMQWLVLAP